MRKPNPLNIGILLCATAISLWSMAGCMERTESPKQVVRKKIVQPPETSAPQDSAEKEKGGSEVKATTKPGTSGVSRRIVEAPPQKPPAEPQKEKPKAVAKAKEREEAKDKEVKKETEFKEEKKEEIEVPYIYNPKGRPDPFRPFIKEVKIIQPLEGRVPLTPLQRGDVSQFKLVAILSAEKERSAMVEDGSGKGYIVKIGTYIGKNGGRVIQILSDHVMVEEQFIDIYGEKKTNRIALRLKTGLEVGGK